VPRNSISPSRTADPSLASYWPHTISLPEANSKMVSSVSGMVRSSSTANRPPCADNDAGASSPSTQRMASNRCTPQLAICEE
jgi:hypothetical protein